jgi:hypothetical protein
VLPVLWIRILFQLGPWIQIKKNQNNRKKKGKFPFFQELDAKSPSGAETFIEV